MNLHPSRWSAGTARRTLPPFRSPPAPRIQGTRSQHELPSPTMPSEAAATQTRPPAFAKRSSRRGAATATASSTDRRTRRTAPLRGRAAGGGFATSRRGSPPLYPKPEKLPGSARGPSNHRPPSFSRRQILFDTLAPVELGPKMGLGDAVFSFFPSFSLFYSSFLLLSFIIEEKEQKRQNPLHNLPQPRLTHRNRAQHRDKRPVELGPPRNRQVPPSRPLPWGARGDK